MTEQHTATAATSLPSGTWQLDPAETTVTVTVKKLLLWTIPATLTVAGGTIEIDDDGTVSAIDVTADAGSYTSGMAKRNEEVIGPKLLDAATYPTITFHADTVVPASGGFRADGTVTVKGTTSPISLDVKGVDANGTTGTFQATATVDRRSIGVDAMPSLIIGNDLDITISAGVRRAA